jgi:hypothetical protein
MTLEPLQKLMAKKVNRKEFLLYFGLLLITVTGVSGVLKSLSQIGQEKPTNGFGSGGYGA